MLGRTIMNRPASKTRPEAASLVVSRAPELVALVQRSCSASWCVEARDDWRRLERTGGDPEVGIVVLDDDVVPEEKRSEVIATTRGFHTR
jgi:hypothetical protein